MNRTITTKRLYSMGDFQNLEFTDSISELPENITLNSDLVCNLRFQQIVEMELLRKEYAMLLGTYAGKTPEEVIKLLEEIRRDMLQKLKEILPPEIKFYTEVKLVS